MACEQSERSIAVSLTVGGWGCCKIVKTFQTVSSELACIITQSQTACVILIIIFYSLIIKHKITLCLYMYMLKIKLNKVCII